MKFPRSHENVTKLLPFKSSGGITPRYVVIKLDEVDCWSKYIGSPIIGNPNMFATSHNVIVISPIGS
ncbi:uncharacterized protein M6B38_101185 [Iris pallida]|uniref:Uncharacterized protein n=1 Tax=Iris pallida TaxID=29817 RepID=A0AAX6F0G9_IRIPA|nr:Uncharacterized protein M6B38_212225 [Iris pallida]KAJ6801540.1 uncharacterized protein M6B38_197310 [Iris pallida]KAJ6807553.1 uncharacterized protein M6B38_170720 [Iris pallida]KAJ6807777.1 uncharacterized protein M6B38_171400 [Iris pallida]KAJ6809892.1 uncharacterized protein M6B38_159735 [Iris pallida]